jgi:hypothetical protein
MPVKVFSQAKIAQCLQILEQLAQSGLDMQAFAKARGMRYAQLRSWHNHEARWRQRLAPKHSVNPDQAGVTCSGFVQVHSLDTASPSVAPQRQSDAQHSIRIECTHGTRSATVYWPASHSLQCAQWLAAYLE